MNPAKTALNHVQSSLPWTVYRLSRRPFRHALGVMVCTAELGPHLPKFHCELVQPRDTDAAVELEALRTRNIMF
jgi:hypothetical protein